MSPRCPPAPRGGPRKASPPPGPSRRSPPGQPGRDPRIRTLTPAQSPTRPARQLPPTRSPGLRAAAGLGGPGSPGAPEPGRPEEEPGGGRRRRRARLSPLCRWAGRDPQRQPHPRLQPALPPHVVPVLQARGFRGHRLEKGEGGEAAIYLFSARPCCVALAHLMGLRAASLTLGFILFPAATASPPPSHPAIYNYEPKNTPTHTRCSRLQLRVTVLYQRCSPKGRCS